MSIDHEQQTELTNINKTTLSYPNRTQLANNDSTEIDYTIRLVLANTDDSEKENDSPDIRRFNIAKSLEHTAENDIRLATLWILLKDIHLVSALIRQVRIKFNYLCTNLIEIFVNISKIE